MKRTLPITLFLSCMHCMPVHAATQVYKCVSPNSPIIFSDTDCPAGTQQSMHNVLQPMLIPALSTQVIEQTTRKRPRQHNKTRVTVVGEQSHSCAAINPQQRRTAMVRKQVKSGMNQADIESMYGKPIKTTMSNGVLTAIYRSTKGQKRSVRFDEHGCVRLSQKPGTARVSKNKPSSKKK